MIRVAILLFLCVVGNSNEDGDWLKCKPKPGCSIARCDPTPGHWLENLDKLNDYSILCQKNEPSDDSDAAKNYTDVLEELSKLKGRLEKSEREGSEIKAEMKILERENSRMKNQMEEEANDLRKEWQELKDQLAEMKGPVASGMNKSSSFSDNGTKGSCNITFNGICYWTHVADDQNVIFARGEKICSSKASTPAHFPNVQVYNSVVEELRSKIQSEQNWVEVWTGVIIDTNTENVVHPSGDTYVNWYPSYPRTGSSHKTRTHIALNVQSDPESTNQGMFNLPPQWSYQGVVCQRIE